LVLVGGLVLAVGAASDGVAFVGTTVVGALVLGARSLGAEVGAAVIGAVVLGDRIVGATVRAAVDGDIVGTVVANRFFIDGGTSESEKPLTALAEITRYTGDPMLFHMDSIMHSA